MRHDLTLTITHKDNQRSGTGKNMKSTRACYSLRQLKDIWLAWNRMTAGDFSAYIGYDPDTGQRIQP